MAVSKQCELLVLQGDKEKEGETPQELKGNKIKIIKKERSGE